MGGPCGTPSCRSWEVRHAEARAGPGRFDGLLGGCCDVAVCAAAGGGASLVLHLSATPGAFMRTVASKTDGSKTRPKTDGSTQAAEQRGGYTQQHLFLFQAPEINCVRCVLCHCADLVLQVTMRACQT